MHHTDCYLFSLYFFCWIFFYFCRNIVFCDGVPQAMDSISSFKGWRSILYVTIADVVKTSSSKLLSPDFLSGCILLKSLTIKNSPTALLPSQFAENLGSLGSLDLSLEPGNVNKGLSPWTPNCRSCCVMTPLKCSSATYSATEATA